MNPKILMLVENVTDSEKSDIAAKLVNEHGYSRIRTCSTGIVDGDTYHMSVDDFQKVMFSKMAEYTTYEDPRLDQEEPWVWRGTFKKDLEEGSGYKVGVIPPESAEKIKKAYPHAFIVNMTSEDLPNGFVPDLVIESAVSDDITKEIVNAHKFDNEIRTIGNTQDQQKTR